MDLTSLSGFHWESFLKNYNWSTYQIPRTARKPNQVQLMRMRSRARISACFDQTADFNTSKCPLFVKSTSTLCDGCLQQLKSNERIVRLWPHRLGSDG